MSGGFGDKSHEPSSFKQEMRVQSLVWHDKTRMFLKRIKIIYHIKLETIKLGAIFGHCLHVLGVDGWQPVVVGGDVADPVLLLSPGQLLHQFGSVHSLHNCHHPILRHSLHTHSNTLHSSSFSSSFFSSFCLK